MKTSMRDADGVSRISGHGLALPGQWAGYEIPTSFPIRSEAAKATLTTALWNLLSRLSAQDSQIAVWLLMDSLHKDDAVLTLSRNARAWIPSQGLGLWPGQPPPRTMTGKDMLDLEWGATPRLPYHRVTLLRATSEILHTAWTTMFGLGSSILTLGPGGSQRMLGETRATSKASITDEGFQDFPFYFPLLGKRALATATAANLDSWLGPAQLYLRESEEDNSFLLLARSTPELLRNGLHQAGFEHEPVPEQSN